MADAALWVLSALALAQAGLMVALLLRKSGPAGTASPDLEPRLARLEALLREESERSRREAGAAAAESRGELARSVKDLGDILGGRIREGAEAQTRSNETFGTTLGKSLAELRTEVEQNRSRLADGLETFRESMVKNLMTFGAEQGARFSAADLKDAEQARALRTELGELNDRLSGTLLQRVSQLNTDMAASWTRFSEELGKLSAAQGASIGELRATVEANLKSMREDNEQRLEKMRQTVDEKLHNTLEQRLGESFKLVSERLENVQKGLGEMQALASGVGDLKRVLTNVKTRGTWGEVLLSNLLEQVLTPEQYAANVATTGTAERVEFAIKLPGKSADRSQPVWLPIDSKFPKEDYERLILAQEAADADGAHAAGAALESSIKRFAQDVCNKYIETPKTTDFAIMFLPSEGLYAEIIRRTETVTHLQQHCRVLVCGPTTLAALLNSLQMGFKTLAIEQRSSEVWDLLGAVKTEFGKYADVMEKVQKKLQEASNTIDSAHVRTRAIARKLKSVEQMDHEKTAEVFPQNLLEDELA